MPTATSLGGRIRTNISSKMAHDALLQSGNQIAKSQLKITTGRRINQAADDVSGYITSRSLISRNSTLESNLLSTGEAINVTTIVQDAYDNVHNLVTEIKRSAILASSDSIGTSEKVALAKSAYRLAQQVDLVSSSATFGGRQLLDGTFSSDWLIGIDAEHKSLSVNLDLRPGNEDLNVLGQFGLSLDSDEFAGIRELDLSKLDEVTTENLGVFGREKITKTITDLANALDNVSNVAAYVGGFQARLFSQNDALLSQISNYKGAISRIDDADVAEEQVKLSKQEFLHQASLLSMSQANSSPFNYFRLIG